MKDYKYMVEVAPVPGGKMLGHEPWRKEMQERTSKVWKDYMPIRDQISAVLDVQAGGLWVDNLKANRMRIREAGDATIIHKKKGKGKACILAGAGPSLKENYKALYKVRYHALLVCMNSNLKFLLDKGIKPDMVLACDGDPVVAEHLDVGETNIPLVCSTLVSPAVLDVWKGPISFIWYDLDNVPTKTARKWLHDGEHFDQPFPSAGSVFNMGFLFTHIIMHHTCYIFCGLDLSWWQHEELHVGTETKRDGFLVMKTGVGDVETDYAMMRDKLWLEETISRMHVFVINSTEAGIFGMSKEGPIPGIAHMPLDQSIGTWNWNRKKWEEKNPWVTTDKSRVSPLTSSVPSQPTGFAEAK